MIFLEASGIPTDPDKPCGYFTELARNATRYAGAPPLSMVCDAPDFSKLGDGSCDDEKYNNPQCRYDLGDCCEYTCKSNNYRCGPYTCKDPCQTNSTETCESSPSQKKDA